VRCCCSLRENEQSSVIDRQRSSENEYDVVVAEVVASAFAEGRGERKKRQEDRDIWTMDAK